MSAYLIAGDRTLATAFYVSLYAWIAVEVWVWLRERGGTKGENRDRGSRLWIVISFSIGIWLAFGAMYALPATAIRHGRLEWFWAGIVLMWLGEGFRFWAVRTLGRFFRTSVILQEGHVIVSRGPYRFLRNPSYTGATVACLGMGLAMNNWLSVALAAGGALVAYARRIAVEQEALVEHFGQPYRDYIARTWAFIPFLW